MSPFQFPCHHLASPQPVQATFFSISNLHEMSSGQICTCALHYHPHRAEIVLLDDSASLSRHVLDRSKTQRCPWCTQAGHALAAASEGVGVQNVGAFTLLLLPGAYVALDSGALATLGPWRTLRVCPCFAAASCVPVKHNIGTVTCNACFGGPNVACMPGDVCCGVSTALHAHSNNMLPYPHSITCCEHRCSYIFIYSP